MAEAIILGAILPVVFEKAASLSQSFLTGRFEALFGVDIPREIAKLKDTLSTIQAVAQDAEEKQLKDKAVGLWLARLKDAARDADDLLDEFEWEILRQQAEGRKRDKVKHFFSSENPILFRARMGRRIKEVAERFHAINAEKNEFRLNVCHGPLQPGTGGGDCGNRETHSYVIESEVVGRREDKARIVETMIGFDRRDSPSILPIVGMGGLGKTTLAQMAYNDPRIKGHFQMLMWVCVSDDFDVPRLAREIVTAAGGNGSSDASMDSLQRSLREMLGSKRYLLVLDDLWNEDPTKWDELRVLLSHGSQGSAVLATTRSEKVASIVGTIESYRLDQLSEEDCWTVFKQRAFASREAEPQSLVEIGKRIVRKFGRLPLAAKTVGSFMRLKKSEKEWLSVLRSEIWDLPAECNKILPALRLSYDHLPSYLKECFTFCAIFPKDFSLDKDLLVQLWMANGFIPCRKKTELEAEGHQIFDELVSRCFLQNVEEVEGRWKGVTTTRCKMHDLIHDLAQAVTKNECRIVNGREVEENRNATVHHVSIVKEATNTIIDKAMSGYSKGMRTLFRLKINWPGPHLRALQCAWLKFKSLRVLSLAGIGLKELPTSVNHLKHLRYLDLSRNIDLQTLPETVTHLFHLQTLKLEDCRKVCDLPKGMKNMKSLVHLCIDGCDGLVCMPRGMENLVHLQTLSRFVVGGKADSCSIRELKELNIRGKLGIFGLGNVKSAADAKGACLSSKHNLETLTLQWDINEPGAENVNEVMESLQPHQNIRQLEIQNYAGTSFPKWMMTCATNLTKLLRIELYGCRKCEPLPALGQLRFLEALHLRGMYAVKYLGGTFYGAGGDSDVEIFPSLKELRLEEMANLEEWLGMEVTGASSSFPQLTTLEIFDCAKLTTMPHLPSVEKFTIHRCPLLLLQKQHFLQMNSLRKLSIKGSSKLVTLLTEEEVRGSTTSLGHLQFMFIGSCDELTSLSDEFLSCLSSLKRLRIESCENLVGSFSSLPSLDIGRERGLQLQHLTSLESLDIWGCKKLVGEGMGLPPCLQELRIRDCTNIQSLPEGMGRITTLRRLEIGSLPRLASPPQLPGCLTSLKRLSIKYCDNLASLPEGLGCLTSLEELFIISCRNLASLPEGLGCLTSLKELSITFCSNLASLPEGLGCLASLKGLFIISCDNLASLPDGLRCLTSLETLKITGCGSMTALPESLGCLTHLRELRVGSHGLASLPQSIGCLTALENLRVEGCSKLTSLPHGLWGLTQLTSLAVRGCTELTALPEGLEGLTKLESLEIAGCPKLTSWPKSLQRRLLKLESLEIRRCPVLGRSCEAGGEYWRLVADIPRREIRE